MSDFDERDLLTRELRERSQEVGGHPIGLDAVKARAGGIRRRRSIVSGVVAAAVLAVAVPAGISVTHTLNQPQFGPAQQPTRPSSPSPSPRHAGSVRRSFDQLSRGADSAISYLRGKTLVLADGQTVRLEKEYQEIAPLGSGWVALAQQDGNYTRDILDSTGRVTDSMGQALATLPSTFGLAVDVDGSRVAWTEMDNGRWNVVEVTADGRDRRSPANPQNHEVRAVGYVAHDALVYNSHDRRGHIEARVLEPSGRDVEVPAKPRLWGAVSTSQARGLVAGQEVADGSACWLVVAYETGETAFRTCDFGLDSFSPDGRFIIGNSAETDGAGARDLAVLDARTGDVVVRFEQPRDGQMYLGQAVWEDDDHVLAPLTDGLETEVVRFGLDGSMETASGVVKSPDYFLPSPIRFSAQP